MKKRIVEMIILIAFAVALTLLAAQIVQAADFMYEDDVYQMCEQVVKDQGNKISPEWLQAVAEVESRYDAAAENGSCKGLCQINPYVWKDKVKKYGGDVFDPYTNLSVAAEILTELYEMSPEDPYWVMLHYNMSTKKADQLYEQGKYTKYCVEVMELSAEKERKHGK